MKCLNPVSRFLRDFARGVRSYSTDYVDFELREKENIFALLLVGSFVGLPNPPSHISVRLMPHIVCETYVMSRRAEDMDDISGEIFTLFAPCCGLGKFGKRVWTSGELNTEERKE